MTKLLHLATGLRVEEEDLLGRDPNSYRSLHYWFLTLNYQRAEFTLLLQRRLRDFIDVKTPEMKPNKICSGRRDGWLQQKRLWEGVGKLSWVVTLMAVRVANFIFSSDSLKLMVPNPIAGIVPPLLSFNVGIGVSCFAMFSDTAPHKCPIGPATAPVSLLRQILSLLSHCLWHLLQTTHRLPTSSPRSATLEHVATRHSPHTSKIIQRQNLAHTVSLLLVRNTPQTKQKCWCYHSNRQTQPQLSNNLKILSTVMFLLVRH